jgi:tetratricopeptide (TPR) repeat protein
LADCLAGHSYGRALLLRGRYQEALPYLQQGAHCPDRRWAWFDLARAQYELGQWEAAGYSWRQAGAAEHAHRLARQIAGQSDRAQAIRAWEMAVNADPKAVAPYLELARLWQETDLKQAEAALRRGLQANPNDVTLLKM